MAITFGLFGVKRNHNLRAWEKAMAGLPARTLPVSVAYALNGVAFKARDLLRDEAKRVFDRPTDFAVKNAFFYEVARLSATSVGQLRSRVYIKDRQSAFYKFQVDGGARFPGDIGPGSEWLFVPVAKELINPRTGGLRNNVLKGLARRTGLTYRQVTAGQARRDSKKAGVFVGELFGTKAIWERPARSAMLAPRRKGVRQVRNQGAPRLLVAMFKREQYRPCSISRRSPPWRRWASSPGSMPSSTRSWRGWRRRGSPGRAAVRATIYKAIAKERRAQGVRGDQLVELYETAAAEEAATRLRLSVAEQICAMFSGTPMELYYRVRKNVPSAKPCRMGVSGLGGSEAQQQLRIGDIEGWGLKRLLGVASSLGLEPVIELRQRRR